MRNNNENQIHTNEKLTIGKHIIRALLILTVLLPLISEIYFMETNLKSFYSGKDWVKVSINENHEVISKINNSRKNNIQIYNKFGIDSSINHIVLLILNPYDYILNGKLNTNKKINLRGSEKDILNKSNLINNNINILKKDIYNNNNNVYDKIFIKKNECDCDQLRNNYVDSNTNNNEWYILGINKKDYIITPRYLQVVSVIILLLRWTSIIIYVCIQLLMPIKIIQESVDTELIRSSSLSIFYIASSSLCLSIIGIEGKDCINWWFLGPNPEYLLKSQIFVWLITCISIVLYLIQFILESTIELSRKYKLINDFITTFIYIPLGIIVILSISLCILGIIKPWIFLIWITSLFIELEKNIRILTKLCNERNISDNINNNSIRNIYRSNQNNMDNIDEINIIELVEDNLWNNNNNKNDSKGIKNKIDDSLYKNIIIIPISNSYFKIFEFNLNNCITRLHLWFINKNQLKCNNIFTNLELNEYNDKRLEVNEFLYNLDNTLEIKNNINIEDNNEFNNEKSMSLSTTHVPSNSDSYSRVNSFQTTNSDDSHKDKFVCNICYLEFNSIIIFTPCGHGNVCIECLGDYISNNFRTKQHPKCHICREEIFKMIEIFRDGEQNDKNLNSLIINKSMENFNNNLDYISDVKLIAEITSDKRNSNQFNNNENSRDNFSNRITLKISRKNSDLWTHPRIKEFIRTQNRTFNNRIYNFIVRSLNICRL